MANRTFQWLMIFSANALALIVLVGIARADDSRPDFCNAKVVGTPQTRMGDGSVDLDIQIGGADRKEFDRRIVLRADFYLDWVGSAQSSATERPGRSHSWQNRATVVIPRNEDHGSIHFRATEVPFTVLRVTEITTPEFQCYVLYGAAEMIGASAAQSFARRPPMEGRPGLEETLNYIAKRQYELQQFEHGVFIMRDGAVCTRIVRKHWLQCAMAKDLNLSTINLEENLITVGCVKPRCAQNIVAPDAPFDQERGGQVATRQNEITAVGDERVVRALQNLLYMMGAQLKAPEDPFAN